MTTTLEETTYYTDNQVQVTCARVVFPAVTFALRNISSVRKYVQHPSHVLDMLMISLGILILLIGFVANSGGTIAFDVIIGVLGILIYTRKKDIYSVLVGTNAGEHKGLVESSQKRIDEIVSAIKCGNYKQVLTFSESLLKEK